jgi:hypothetical protein
VDALASAIGVAALALLAKVLYDVWNHWLERRGVASALAGEIGAYITLLKPETMIDALRTIATMARKDRQNLLRSFGELADTHPVFDKIAHKIGLLPPRETLEISAFYNIVTGFRIQMTGLSSERFLEATDGYQVAILKDLAQTLEEQAPKTHELVARLLLIAGETFWSRWLKIIQDALTRGSTKALRRGP